jgi:Aconitase A
MNAEPGTVGDIEGARCLVMLGDSVTTDHVSPAGSIKPDSPAASTSSSTASSGRTSTRTARGAATTR